MSLKTPLSLKKHTSKGGDHLWAVSYADFLMVLLSFFIIFFSTDTTIEPMRQLVMDLKQIGQEVGQPATTVKPAPGIMVYSPVAVKSLLSNLKTTYQISASTPGRVILNLPENVFGPADFYPPAKSLEAIVRELKPYTNDVKVKIIGHSDRIGFMNRGPRVVDNNLTLAAIRASYTANYLKAFYPELDISAEADDQNLRTTRSISVEISAKTGASP